MEDKCHSRWKEVLHQWRFLGEDLKLHYLQYTRMDSYSGVVTCLWRHSNIFIYELSFRDTKVTASCKNWKTWPKQAALNFLLLLVAIAFTVVNVYQKLPMLQVIFQWIIIIILISFERNMYRNLCVFLA